MELYLSLTVRLWSCEPIILALPLNRWWSRPSPRLQPVRGRGELDATDLGNAFDCTRVCVNLQSYDTRNERIFIYIFVHYNSLSLSFLVCMSPCPLYRCCSFVRGGLWETAGFHCARDAALQFGPCHPAAQSVGHWQRAAVQLSLCEWLALNPQSSCDVFTHCERNRSLYFY